jgi:D-alanyl-D-alanine carboxypeptidase/D-alanyl-D-alanine-endopeptidase (penicillin-binding protein 4)
MPLAALALAALAAVACAAEPPLQDVARELVGADQGVYVEAEDGTVLAAAEAERAVHPASVSKVATTLALLERLGPGYRFETRVFATGPMRDGTVHGNLLVEAGGDPHLVSENALAVLLALRRRGLRTIEGRFRAQGQLLFNWQPDPEGRAMAALLQGRDGAGAWAAVERVRPEARGRTPAELGLRFAGRAGGLPDLAPELLVVHRSAPLIRVVKALNCYSNNVFHLAAQHIGGAAAVEQVARAHLPAVPGAEVVIDNGAGAGTTNRLSPRAAVGLLRALAGRLRQHRLALPDALPVSRLDPGTLRERLPAGIVVGKTGTFGSVGASALAGVLRTRRYGEVAFAVLNRGVPVPEAQRRQNAFVTALIEATGAVPWDYRGVPLPTFAEAQLDPSE